MISIFHEPIDHIFLRDLNLVALLVVAKGDRLLVERPRKHVLGVGAGANPQVLRAGVRRELPFDGEALSRNGVGQAGDETVKTASA